MTDDRAVRRYRQLYARLLRLYPREFGDRFAESMEQTFADLCRERRAAGAGLLVFVLGLMAETTAGIIRERRARIMPPRKNIVRLAVITAIVLSIPLVGMGFSDEVDWSPFDFIVAGALIFGAGFTFETIARKMDHAAYRLAVGLACGAALLLVWINLAVGLLGSEDDPANLLYLFVLAVGVVGTAFARLRPRGMARTLIATAAAQFLVPLVALAIWRPTPAYGGDVVGFVGVLFLNTVFALVFVLSAILFRRADEARSGPSAS